MLSIILRRWRRIAVAALLFGLLATYYYRSIPSSRVHEITGRDIELEASRESNADKSTGYLPVAEAEALCRTHKWNVFNADQRQQRRKIYDLFMVNNELDWLEIRLETMAKHVDYFVILEAAVTFTGLEKPLIMKDNWGRFAKFQKQIIYKVLENPPLGASRSWDYEDYQRNAMFSQVIPGLEGEQAASIGDVILVSDIDEIVRPAALQIMRNCDFPRRLTLRSQFYYYGFEFLHEGPEWEHPQATTFQGVSDTILPANLRNGEGGNRLRAWWHKADLWNAGWHCSSCFATVEDMLTKLRSFSHMSLNKEEYRDHDRIVNRVKNGLDLWDREGETYRKIPDNKDIPEILKREKERFKYLLDRQGEDGGFTDYHPDGKSAGQAGQAG